MSNQFEVFTDSSGRIKHYKASDSSEEVLIMPEAMSSRVKGDVRLLVNGVEYKLTKNGSLIAVDIDFDDSTILGSGVRLGPGTKFKDYDHPKDRVEIGDRARVEGTAIDIRVVIGNQAIIRAQSIGANTVIGDHSRIGEHVEIFPNVEIGEAVKIDRFSLIKEHATIEYAARLGYRTTLGANSIVGHHSAIGSFSGDNSRYASGGGKTIADDKTIPPHTNM